MIRGICRTIQFSAVRSLASTQTLAHSSPKYRILQKLVKRTRISSFFFISNLPFFVHFTKDHEWVQQHSEFTFIVGITKHAADNLGEITYLGLDELQEIIDDEEVIEAGETLCEIESVKSAATIGAPISGTPVSINDKLGDEDGKLMNADPENTGYLCEISAENVTDAVSNLMTQEAYDAFLEEEK